MQLTSYRRKMNIFLHMAAVIIWFNIAASAETRDLTPQKSRRSFAASDLRTASTAMYDTNKQKCPPHNSTSGRRPKNNCNPTYIRNVFYMKSKPNDMKENFQGKKAHKQFES